MINIGLGHYLSGDHCDAHGVWRIEQPDASDSRDRGGKIGDVRQFVGFRLIGLSVRA